MGGENILQEYLSIITNFGCHYTCPYCIVKENDLRIPYTTVNGLTKFGKIANRFRWVSVSGGGDPLYNFEENKAWWKAFQDCTDNNFIELHTSYLNVPSEVREDWDRIVYHVRSFEQLELIKKYDVETIRVVFVVTQDFTEDLINKIAVYCNNSDIIDELSFRQMIDSNYLVTEYCKDYLSAGHKKLWWYIEQNDYNTYYAENKIYHNYKDFEKEQKNIA